MNADIKPWQERCDWTSEEPATKLMVAAMKAENAELRAEVERLRAELAAGAARQGGGTSENSRDQNSTKTAETRMDAAFEGGPSGAAGTGKDALRLFLGAAYPVAPEINPRGYNWCEAYLDQARDAAIGAHTKAGSEPA